MNELIVKEVALPEIGQFTAPMLDALTLALGVDRSVLASDKQIQNAWNSLPALIESIPGHLRNESMMRMCVAIASGLFDSALNYIWNAAIVELREKVRVFGIHIIPQITGKPFDEKRLSEMQDNELLQLCLKLNLISENGFFMLDQCRDIRNNFSAAHPTIGNVDEYELTNFLNRCSKFAFSTDQNTSAVDIKEFMVALDAGAFSEDQSAIWCERIEGTFDAQKEAIFVMLHGIYCDSEKHETARINALTICQKFASIFTPNISSSLINQHQRYVANGRTDKHKASQAFFQHIGLLSLLSSIERHSLLSSACKNLSNVHNGMNNFYNERAFAERLNSLANGQEIPSTVQPQFVETVVTCSVGNPYGTADSADNYYCEMVKEFSPREVQIMLELPNTKTVVANRINSIPRCFEKYKSLVKNLQPQSVPTSVQTAYSKWVA